MSHPWPEKILKIHIKQFLVLSDSSLCMIHGPGSSGVHHTDAARALPGTLF